MIEIVLTCILPLSPTANKDGSKRQNSLGSWHGTKEEESPDRKILRSETSKVTQKEIRSVV